MFVLKATIVRLLLMSSTWASMEHILCDHLLTNYSRSIRPVRKMTTVTEVYMDPGIYNLVDVNEKQETMTIMLWTPMYWTDEYLIWEPDNFENISEIRIPLSKLWVPDITPFSILTQTDTQPWERNYASIRANGTVFVVFDQVLVVRCLFDIVDFPLDTQNCTIPYGSWGFEIDMVVIKWYNSNLSFNLFKENSEWKLIEYRAREHVSVYHIRNEATKRYSELLYTLVLERKPAYYVFVLLIPSFLIGTLCIIGLFTPFSSTGERQERVTFGLTTLLTMAVILQIVTNEMPKSADGLPLLGEFILIEIVLAFIGISVTVVIMFLHERAMARCHLPPKWLFTLCYLDSYYMLKHRSFNVDASHQCFDNWPSHAPSIRIDNGGSALMKALKATLDGTMNDEANRAVWTELFRRIDIVLLIVFLNANTLILTLRFLLPTF
uniref:Uncharacterized protein n=1 Tax=Plectus sambesii TaxID=2011161 RepID=A0A914UIB2_9BILA